MKLTLGFLSLFLTVSLHAFGQGAAGASSAIDDRSKTEGGATEVGFYCKECKGWIVGGKLLSNEQYDRLLNTPAVDEAPKSKAAGGADGAHP